MRFICFELENSFKLAIQSADQIIVVASFASKDEAEQMRQALQDVSKGASWTRIKKEVKPKFDLNALYELYPRREGKAAGMKKLQAIIKEQEDYDRMKLAIELYSEDCKRRGREPQYIMMFSTFVNGRYRDYVESQNTVDQSALTQFQTLDFGW